jgi:transcriptional regulator with XRE-family HTH domain/KaiC/GvpD/RAD55 family RecA-like ATPase
MMNSERTRISTGITALDPILGGLLIGDNVVWYDDAGSLASVFLMNFLKVSQAQKKPFIYVSFDRSPRNLLDKLGPLAEYENLTILDCFTYGKGKGVDTFFQFYKDKNYQWPCQLVHVNTPQDPDAVMDHFLSIHAAMKNEVRFVFESLTGMQELWEGEDQISRFYSHTCPRLYELNTVGYWIMEKDAHSKRLKASINQIAQVAIELSLKRGKNSLSILKAENREIDSVNTPYSYSAKGSAVSFDEKKYASAQVDLGKRIKALRTKRGMSQTELARLIGVTPSNISQIESNQIYPSLPALFKAAEILSIDVGSFFQELPDVRNRIIFSGAEAVDIQIPDLPRGVVSAKLLAPMDADIRTEPYLIEFAPKKSLPGHLFIHKGDELGYLISGKLQMKIGNTVYALRAGDVIYLSKEVPSQWKNPGPVPAQLFWLKLK